MARQVQHDIIDVMTRGFLLIVLADFDDCYALHLAQEWQRVPNCPACLAGVLPSDHNMVCSKGFDCARHHEEAIGALSAGINPDIFGMAWAIGAIAALTFLSGTIVAVFMRGHPNRSLDLAQNAHHSPT